MLRNPPSKIPLSMADVNQLKHRPKHKQASHAQTDWPCVHPPYQNTRRHPPPPAIYIRQGAQRSRDDCVVHLDPNRHVPQSAVFEFAADSDSSDTASTTLEFTARLVQIAEVSPTITQVSSYNPPAILNTSPEQSPVRNHRHSHTSPVSHPHHPENPLVAVENRNRENASHSPLAQPTQPRSSPHRSEFTHFRNNGPETGVLTRAALLDPHAPAFVPRVRFGSTSRDFSYNYSTLSSDYGSKSGQLRLRSASQRNSDYSGELPRPRNMPRPRAPTMYQRQPVRGPWRTGAASTYSRTGHPRPPAPSSSTAVMDRYPVFTSTSTQINPMGLDQDASLPLEEVPMRRGASGLSPGLRTNHLLYSQPRFSPTAEPYQSIRMRASSSSLSAPNLISSFGESLIHPRDTSFPGSNYMAYQSYSAPSQAEIEASAFPDLRSSGSLDTDGEQIYRWHSPLDELTRKFHRQSASFSEEPLSSLGSRSYSTSTDGRLLSGNLFYSDSDEEVGSRDFLFHDGPSSHNIAADRYYGTSRNITPGYDSSLQNRGMPGHAALMSTQAADADVDYRKNKLSPSSMPPPIQSDGSASRIAPSILDSSPPAPIPDRVLRTPGNLPFTPNSNNRHRTTPRVIIYDDSQPADTQPRTPADLIRRERGPVHPSSLLPGPRRTAHSFDEMAFTEHSPLVPASSSNRNTYPSLQQPYASHHVTGQRSNLYSPNSDLRNAAAMSALERRRATRRASSEQMTGFDDGTEAEREPWMHRMAGNTTATATTDRTPLRGKVRCLR